MKKKEVKVETREEKIKKALDTLKEVPTATKVKAWTFQIGKVFYVIISFFAPRYGQQMSVYLSNRKGIKTSNDEIDLIKGAEYKDNYQMMFDQVIQKLIPEETVLERTQREMADGTYVFPSDELVYRRPEELIIIVPPDNDLDDQGKYIGKDPQFIES